MAEDSQTKKHMTRAEVEKRVRTLLDAPAAEYDLRGELETLAKEPAFSGLTWLWGPLLYERNKVLFRPFILNHFSPTQFEPKGRWGRWEWVAWEGHVGRILDDWLDRVDRNDDIELFKRLYPWKRRQLKKGQADRRFRDDLTARFKAAGSAAARGTVLAKFDLWFEMIEAAAVALYERDSTTAKPFILKHLPAVWGWGGEERVLWADLARRAQSRGDDEFYFALYRRQVPLDQWKKDILRLCKEERENDRLIDALEKRHPQGYGLELGQSFYELAETRGRDVLPYILKHMRDVWSTWLRGGYDRLLDFAREKEWFDLWATMLRVSATPKEFNREVARLLENHGMDEREVRRRLLMLAGVSREWNYPGLSFARVQPLDDKVAVAFYKTFPDLLRGPFKINVSITWWKDYPKLLVEALKKNDEDLIDFMASRLATRGIYWGEIRGTAEIKLLSDYYNKMRDDELAFSRRAAAVLGQIPAYSIHQYRNAIRSNRLARLLFERSASSYLNDPGSLCDLVEAPEIHVQALAYRTLGLDDDRARRVAADNLNILLGTLLRPLHRQTRILAFGALFNAATTEESARRILARAREALDLPDKRYPKEKLVGLIGRLLHRWPVLRGECEQPTIYEEAVS